MSWQPQLALQVHFPPGATPALPKGHCWARSTVVQSALMGAKRRAILLSLHYGYLGLCWHQHVAGAGARFWSICLTHSQPARICPADWPQGAQTGLLPGETSGPWECLYRVPPPHGHLNQAGAGLKKTPRHRVVWGGSSALTHSTDLPQLCCTACWCRWSHGLLQNPPRLWSAEFWQ